MQILLLHGELGGDYHMLVNERLELSHWLLDRDIVVNPYMDLLRAKRVCARKGRSFPSGDHHICASMRFTGGKQFKAMMVNVTFAMRQSTGVSH